jgi:L-rhamnose mutarotase
MRRYGSCIRLRADRIEEYKRLHAETWPSVLRTIAACNIRNYSIFLKQPENFLFAYFEYHGGDFVADMAKMAEDPDTQRWWKLTDPMQEPFETRASGEWWAQMDEVFHTD